MDALSDDKLKAIQDLQTIMTSVEDGGNVYLNACSIGDELATSIVGLAGDKNVNLYYTSDPILRNADMDRKRIREDKGSMEYNHKTKSYVNYGENDFKKGMSKVSSRGAAKNMKTNISINSQGSPVTLPPKGTITPTR